MPAPDAPRPPSVDALARSLEETGLPKPLLIDAARAALAIGGDAPEAIAYVEQLQRRLLQPVINATGVLLHSNLGRAPLAVDQSAHYSNLEFDLDEGARGSRRVHAGALLARAGGAEAALVVNNGAAAMLLLLAALARGRGVAISRGELIEIGGGFRLPEVTAESGARLVEVGTTNRTRLSDYQCAADDVELILKVHASNYRIVGFTEVVSVAELARLGRPLIVDIGSGLLDAACPWLSDGPPTWLASEPAVRQTLEAGADLVVFSGDKLLGGPQAGIIAGDARLIDRCAAHPLYRAMRPGALILAALQDVAMAYLRRDHAGLPFWAMATTPAETLRARAVGIAGQLASRYAIRPTACMSLAGAGSLPGVEIPSWGLAVEGDHAARLRCAAPKPIIPRVRDQQTVIDLRTVSHSDDPLLVAGLLAALS